MQMCRVATAALVFLLVSGATQARTLDQVPPYLKKEGNFVAYPAIAMGGLGMLVGSVIALPASLIAAPIGWAAGDPLGYAMVPISLLATGGTEIGYNVGGAIPWALKNGFYDAPMAGIARIKGEAPSGLVAQVEPPPLTSGDIQYLASTPEDARIPVELSRHYSSALTPPKEPTSLMLRRQLSPFKPPASPASRASATVGAAGATGAAPAAVPGAVPAVSGAAAAAPLQAAPAARARSTPRSSSVETVSPSAAAPDDADAGDANYDRPSLKGNKKKKRKFSERFGF